MLILVVEDEPLLLFSIAETLREFGHEVIEALGGKAALQEIGNESVDVLLTDIRMPDLDGWTLAEMFRERRPDLPVVYVTGFSSTSRPVPMSAIFQKPFEPEELADHLAALAVR